VNCVADAIEDLSLATGAYARAVIATTAGGTLTLRTPAAREIAEEHLLRHGGYTEPIGSTHTSIHLGTFFVADQLFSLARLLAMEPPAIYAPFVVTRSLLDAASWVYWLAEPSIRPAERLKRRLVLDVLEAGEQHPPDRPEFAQTRARLKRVPADVQEFCRHHGWRANLGKGAEIDGERRPSRAQLIGAVVDRLGSDPARGLGAMMWWKLSGSTHGALEGVMDTIEEADDLDPSQGNAWVVSDGKMLIWLTHVAAEATCRVAARHAALFGDVDDGLEQASLELSHQRVRYVEAALNDSWPG
jgi:hypothetical protein